MLNKVALAIANKSLHKSIKKVVDATLDIKDEKIFLNDFSKNPEMDIELCEIGTEMINEASGQVKKIKSVLKLVVTEVVELEA